MVADTRPAQADAMETTDAQGTLRDMWETRPARPREDRQVAGVASAISRRYDIDPVLVRIGFVVAGFLGVGAAFYIAGWLLLPEAPPDPQAPPGPSRSSRVVAVVGFTIAVLAGFAALFGDDGPWGPGVVVTGLAVLVLLFLLHRSRADRVTGASTMAVPSAAAERPAAAPGATLITTYPPAAAAAPRRRRPPVTAVTAGAALLAGGLTALGLLLAGAMSGSNLSLVLGVVLAVLGSGMLVGAFLRAGRGLIPIALLLAAFTWAALAAPPSGWRGGVGELRASPTTVAALQPSYQRTAGDIRLDLRGLDLAVPAGGAATPVRSSVSLGAGRVIVLLPRDADVALTATAGVGEVRVGPRIENGPDATIEIGNDLGADGVRSGRQLVLDIETGAGDVEVRRG